MAYEFKYRLNSAPEARTDGSGMVAHSIAAIVSIDGGEWEVVPAHSQTFNVPADELEAVLASGNVPSAYKAVLAANIATLNMPLVGWSIAALTEMLDNNAAAKAQADAANVYITETLQLSYPFSFAM